MSLTRKDLVTPIGLARLLVKTEPRIGALAIAFLSSFAAVAEPIQLKLSFFASEHTVTYESAIKPFVDAINPEGKGLLAIEVYPNGALGKAVAEQPGLVLDGVADIAWVVPSQTPYRFLDNELLELPGQFFDAREGTLTYTRMIAARALRGYQDFFVIGAFAGEPESIHMRLSVASIADLKGKSVRANNDTEVAILKELGAAPVFLPLTDTANAISSGRIDGAMAPPVPMIEFGIGRVAPNHYFLRMSCVPQSLLMSRKKFDSLPSDVQAIIRKYSGDWFLHSYIQINEESASQTVKLLESDPKRKVTYPSPTDMQTVDAVFKINR